MLNQQRFDLFTTSRVFCPSIGRTVVKLHLVFYHHVFKADGIDDCGEIWRNATCNYYYHDYHCCDCCCCCCSSSSSTSSMPSSSLFSSPVSLSSSSYFSLKSHDSRSKMCITNIICIDIYYTGHQHSSALVT